MTRAEVEKVHPVNGLVSKVANLYFEPKPWERSGKLYRLLGVGTFKKVIPTGDLLFRNKVILKPTIRHANKWDETTRLAEGIHIIGDGIVSLMSLWQLSENGIPAFVIIQGINLFLNKYPIMLQRYNRARIQRLTEKAQFRISNS